MHDLILSIQEQELAHLHEAEQRQTSQGRLRAVALPVIGFLTETMIWLSTWGDSTWMKSEIAAGPA